MSEIDDFAPSVSCLLAMSVITSLSVITARGSVDEFWWIFQRGCSKVESLKTTPEAPYASQRSIYGVRY